MSKFKNPISELESSDPPTPKIHSRRPSLSSSLSGSFSNFRPTTMLYTGEHVSKCDRVITALGTLEELVAYLGVLKTEQFSEHSDVGIKDEIKEHFLARITQIQETLIDIASSIGSVKRNLSRYKTSRFQRERELISELDGEMRKMFGDLKGVKHKDRPLQIIPGSTELEAKVLYARAICRRAERQLHSVKMNVEESCQKYINKLGDYLLALSLHVLYLQTQEPPLQKVSLKP